MSTKSVEGNTCRLLLFVTRKVFIKHPAQNIKLLVSSIIVHLLPYCARLHREKIASLDYDEDDDTWKDDIDALFDNAQHMEVSLNLFALMHTVINLSIVY